MVSVFVFLTFLMMIMLMKFYPLHIDFWHSFTENVSAIHTPSVQVLCLIENIHAFLRFGHLPFFKWSAPRQSQLKFGEWKRGSTWIHCWCHWCCLKKSTVIYLFDPPTYVLLIFPRRPTFTCILRLCESKAFVWYKWMYHDWNILKA